MVTIFEVILVILLIALFYGFRFVNDIFSFIDRIVISDVLIVLIVTAVAVGLLLLIVKIAELSIDICDGFGVVAIVLCILANIYAISLAFSNNVFVKYGVLAELLPIILPIVSVLICGVILKIADCASEYQSEFVVFLKMILPIFAPLGIVITISLMNGCQIDLLKIHGII